MRALQRLLRPDPAVRQQGRPDRRRRRRRAGRGRARGCQPRHPADGRRSHDAGSRAAGFAAYRPDDGGFRDRETVALAEHDDDPARGVRRGPAPLGRARLSALGRRADRGRPPASGVRRLGRHRRRRPRADGRASPTLLPVPARRPADAAPPGRVFKVERGAAGEKVAYVRMFAGSVRPRQRLDLPDGPARQGLGDRAASRPVGGPARTRSDAGQIARLHGLGEVRVGDGFGRPARRGQTTTSPRPRSRRRSRRPQPEQGPALRAALADAGRPGSADRRADRRRRAGRGVALRAGAAGGARPPPWPRSTASRRRSRDASVLHVERPRRVGRALERLNTDANPYHATIGLRIAPRPPGLGSALRSWSVPAPGHAALPLQERRGVRRGDASGTSPRSLERGCSAGG